MGSKAPEEFCRYYSDSKSWAVMFLNKTSLSVEEVTNMFSKYGSIKHVGQRGSTTGYCIIKFHEKDSAMKCISDHDRDVKLHAFNPNHVKHFIPSKEQKDKNDSSLKKEHKTNSAQERLDRLKMNCSSDNFTSQKTDIRNVPEKNYDDAEEKRNETSNTIEVCDSTQRSDASPLSTTELIKNIALVQDKNVAKLTNKSTSHSKIILNVPEHNKNVIGEVENVISNFFNKRGQTTATDSNCVNGSGQVISTISETSYYSNRKSSDSVCSDSTTSSKQIHLELHGQTRGSPGAIPRAVQTFRKMSPVVASNLLYPVSHGYVTPPVALNRSIYSSTIEHIIAHEVIIANIHVACDVDFIAELFREFEPILISDVKVNSKNYFRYCHIYFKTVRHAQAAEKTYDNLKICGRNLIVLRPESLAEQL